MRITESDVLCRSSHEVTDFHKSLVTPLHHSGGSAPPKPRGVTFDTMDNVYEITNLGDYTDEELEAAWYSAREADRMKQKARSDAKLLDFGILVQGTEVSIRGLEWRTKEGIKKKRRVKMNSHGAIFCEIAYQEEQGFVDDEQIADAYYEFSQHSAEMAAKIGKQDETEAMQIHNDELDDSKPFLQFFPTTL